MTAVQPRRPGGSATGGQFAQKPHSIPEAPLHSPGRLTIAEIADVLRERSVAPFMPTHDAAGARVKRGHPDGIQWLADSGQALIDEASRHIELAQSAVDQRNVAIAHAHKERAEAFLDEGVNRKRVAGAEAQAHGLTLKPTITI